MTEKNKPIIAESGVDKGQVLKTENRQQLQQLLIQLADEKADAKFTDFNLDRENEKIKLLNGSEITLREIREMQTVISKALNEYKPTFQQEFYKEINRLNGWLIPDERLHQKPPIVGRYTNEVIYARFSKEVLPVLQHLNPYTVHGIRLNKHHQWLTPEGKIQLEGFIGDAIRVMKTSSTWYEFRVKYSSEFNVPFQLSLFGDPRN